MNNQIDNNNKKSQTEENSQKLIKEQITRLKLQFDKQQLTKEEATEQVNKLLQSNQLTIDHQADILEFLQVYLIELNKNHTNPDQAVSPPVALIDTESPDIIEVINKRKKPSKFSDNPTSATTLNSGTAELVSSKSSPELKPQSNTSCSANTLITELFSKLETDGYDIKLRREAFENLEKIIEQNSFSSTKLSDRKLEELSHKYGHLFPDMIRLLVDSCGRTKRIVVISQNNNMNEFSQKNLNFE